MNTTRNPAAKIHARKAVKHTALYEAIGILSSEFAGLELAVIQRVAWLIGASDNTIADTVTDKLSYRQTVDLFDRLFRQLITDEARLKRGRDLVKTLEQVGTERNDIIHSAWIVTSPDEYQRLRPRTKNPKMAKEQRMTADPRFIHEVTERIIRATLQMENLLPSI